MNKKNIEKKLIFNNKEDYRYFLHLKEESEAFLNKNEKISGIEAIFYVYSKNPNLSNRFYIFYQSILKNEIISENIFFEKCNILEEVLFIKKDLDFWLNEN